MSHRTIAGEERLKCYGVYVNTMKRSPGSYLVIELANRCSLACVHCAVADTEHPHFEQTGYLDARVADALFSDLAKHKIGFETLILFWLGEPLLHPEFPRIWASALRSAGVQKVFQKIEVHTNATHLSPRVTSALLNVAAVPSVIHFSLDAATRERYLAVKAKDRFDEVMANISHFLKEKSRLGAVWPRPVFQFIVGENNVEEVADLIGLCQGMIADAGLNVRVAAGHVPPGDDPIIFFRQLDCPDPVSQARQNLIFREAMAAQGLSLPEVGGVSVTTKAVAGDGRGVCAGFWKSPVVSWDGAVTTCTRDSRLENKVGHLGEQPFSALWWGETMRRRRFSVAKGDYSGLDGCGDCFIPNSLNYTGISAEEIARYPEPS